MPGASVDRAAPWTTARRVMFIFILPHSASVRVGAAFQSPRPHAWAEAAAPRAGPTGVGDQTLFQDHHGHAALQQFDRRVGRRSREQQAGLAVLALRGALPTAHEEVIRRDAALEVAAVEAERLGHAGEGLHLVRYGRRQRTIEVPPPPPGDADAVAHRP